jgi:hypothetical protein
MVQNLAQQGAVYGTAQGTLLYCMVTIWDIVVAYDIILKFGIRYIKNTKII